MASLLDALSYFRKAKEYLSGPVSDALLRASEVAALIATGLKDASDFLKDIGARHGVTKKMAKDLEEAVAGFEVLKRDVDKMAAKEPARILASRRQPSDMPEGMEYNLIKLLSSSVNLVRDRLNQPRQPVEEELEDTPIVPVTPLTPVTPVVAPESARRTKK